MRLKLIYCIVFLSLLCSYGDLKAQTITPQNITKLQIMEDSMVATVDSMYGAFLPDLHIIYSEILIKQLVKTLKIPNSYYYPFDKLKEKITIMYPEDNSFRMFNWSVDYSVIFNRYYAAIQLPSEQLKLSGLTDYSDKLGLGVDDSVFTNGRWLGANYYRIMMQEVNGERVYMLFGKSAASPFSNKKILEPLTFVSGKPVLGAPVFALPSRQNPKNPCMRFVLEFSKDVHVGLDWDSTKNAIIFDELASQINDPSKRSTYVPTGEYNALIWAGGAWRMKQNILPIQELQDGEAPSDEADKKNENKKKK